MLSSTPAVDWETFFAAIKEVTWRAICSGA